MSFWQNLASSYDANADALIMDYPLSTTSISNNGDLIAVIVIDGDGQFVRVDTIEKANHKKGVETIHICLPVTERSMARASTIEPHPLFDQYEYLQGSGKKFDAYFDNLTRLAESEYATPQIQAIHKYISKREVAADLAGIKTTSKTNIIFEVEITGSAKVKVWEDGETLSACHQFLMCEKERVAEIKQEAIKTLAENQKLTPKEKKALKEQAASPDARVLDYISGNNQLSAVFHPKKISNASANAKLISVPADKGFFTYQGKFGCAAEAVSIGYESTQKAHQFLRYLISDRAYVCGEQAIFSYTIGSMEKLLPPPVEDNAIWSLLKGPTLLSQTDLSASLRAETGIDYAEEMRRALSGYGNAEKLVAYAKTAVAVLDAATTGRLSVTFYRELDRNDYLEHIARWHRTCKWRQAFWDRNENRYVSYIGAPSADKIIEAVYGRPRGANDANYIKIKKAARERLLRCIFDGAPLPFDYVTASIRRTSNPMSLKNDGKFDRASFDRVIATTCALVRKHQQQHNREDYALSIELNRTDRDYLYGRLLGAADKLEEYALYKKGNARTVTAAIRHMLAFSQHPFRTWQTIHGCLNPYIQAAGKGYAYREIQEITKKFIPGDFEKDTPLNGSYLIGYYHEREHIDSMVKKVNANNLQEEHQDLETEEENE